MNKPVTHIFCLVPVFALLSYFLLPLMNEAPEPTTVPEVTIENEAAASCPCTVTQGSFTAALPFMSTNSTAVNFYSYGTPIGTSANTGLEMSETMLIMMHEDLNTGNTSLIFILDQGNDGSGGNGSVTFNCLPGTAYIDFSDDTGEMSGGPPTITGNFNWNACCTDGGIIGGVGCGSTFTINPNINSGINAFSLVYGTPFAPAFVNMPAINCPITINCGGVSCCVEAFEFSATTQNASCESSGNGMIDLSTDCAAAPTFLWSNGAVTEDLIGIDPGVYSVTITDFNGCSQSASYVIDADAPDPQPSITGPTEFCAGDIANLGVSGAYSSYLWSNGSTGPLIFVSTPGTYIVTVTNAAGCTGTASTVLTENPLPMPDIMGPASICLFGDTITLDAGPGFSTYQWSTGSTFQTIALSDYGAYYLTVTNSFGCSGSDFTFIEPLINPIPFILGPGNICSGDPIILDAVGGFDSYLWSTGDQTQIIPVSMAGTYTVTVTNGEGCTGTASQGVTENPADSTLLFQTSCNPLDTGVFTQNLTNQYGCDSVEILTVSLSESDLVFLFDQSCNPLDTGVFTQNLTNQYGCDSLVISTVSFNESDSVFLFDQSCNPLDTGVFTQNLTNENGCDSVVVTTISFNETDLVFLFDQTCNPQDTGVFTQNLINQNGCDSVVTTTVDFILVDTTYLSEATCDPLLAGVFEDLYSGSDGCDSLVITTVDLLFSDTTYLTAITCDIDQAGQSEVLLSNQGGCDSLVITNTTFVSADTTMIFSESCDLGAVGIFEEVLTNSSGCDSILITTVSLLPSDTTTLFETSCDPNQTGTQEMLLVNQFGCDSLVVINTAYAPADSTSLSETTCDPAQAGVFIEILMSSDGCDSVITTTVALLPSDTVYLNAQTCDPANVGVTETLLSNQYGCDSLVVATTGLLPSDTTYLQAISCDINQAGQSEEILSNQYGCDSLIITSTTFVPPDTTLLFAETCDPGQAGMVEVIFQNTFGCDSLVVTTTTLLPSDTTVLQEYSCDPGQVGTTEILLTNVFGCDSLIITNTAQWPVDTTWLFFESCLPADTGLVVTVLSNQYGCDSLVFEQTNLLPASACQLNAQILGDTIGCQQTTGSLWLTFLDGMPPYAYTWTDQNGNTGSGNLAQIGIPQEVSGLPPGQYTFEISDPNGLKTTLSAVIFQPDPLQIDLQISSDYNGFGISCHDASDGSTSVAVVSGGLPPYSFNWSNGSQTGQAIGLGAGWVSVTVTGSTGCVAVDSVQLESPDSIYFSLAVSHPDCFTDGLGAIVIDQVEGGSEPYRYALNGNDWQANPVFDNLSSGSYQVQVADANGCDVSTSTFINYYLQLTVSLGEDETLEYGDSVSLQPSTNVPFFLLDSIYWGGIDCPGCPKVTVVPVATSIYSVTVVDSLGCEASDEIQVLVEKNFGVYIPNVFSPDFNGINDNFTIYGGPQLVQIKELQIFDRWGESVFTYFNFPPNDPAFGWDGSNRGEPLGAAVFVYFAVLEFVDGSTRLVKGDVTLIR